MLTKRIIDGKEYVLIPSNEFNDLSNEELAQMKFDAMLIDIADSIEKGTATIIDGEEFEKEIYGV